jgi:hypothetical protein
MTFKKAAPQGKVHVVTWSEDLDCITPEPDTPFSNGFFDSIEKAKEFVDKMEKKPYTYLHIYNSKGNIVYFRE